MSDVVEVAAEVQPPSAGDARRPDDRYQLGIEQSLQRLVSDGARQFYRDGCRIIGGAVELETASNMLHHCARELEISVREVLVEVLRPAPEAHVCGFDDEELAHSDEIRGVVRALGLRGNIATLWIAVVTGSDYGGGHLAKLSHRRGLSNRPARARPVKATAIRNPPDRAITSLCRSSSATSRSRPSTV